MQDDARLRKIGGRRPIGTAMSPRRRAGLGGTCAPPHPASVQSVLPVHGQRNGGRGSEPGGFSTPLPHTFELSTCVRSFSDLVDERYAQSAGGSLPAHPPRSANGFDGRFHAPVGGKAFFGASAGQAGGGWRIEYSTAARFGAAFPRIEGVGDFARFARSGIQRNSSCVAGAGRYGKIPNQSGAD